MYQLSDSPFLSLPRSRCQSKLTETERGFYFVALIKTEHRTEKNLNACFEISDGIDCRDYSSFVCKPSQTPYMYIVGKIISAYR